MIFRWTSRKKTITGIAVRVEAAISPPQSVLRLVPVKYESQTVTRVLRLVREQHAREDVLVPRRDEREDGRRDEAGRDERQQDADERPDPARAVDHRRLLELLRDAEDEPAQRPDRERQHEGQVGEDHPVSVFVRW